MIFAKQTQKYTEATLNKFYYSCLLHDIGKLGISNEILNKPVPLTNNEYTKMKTHSTLGLEFIKDFSLIEGYESVICSHHEKWDGSGYPGGLKNYEIPLGARIVSIADTFDAMTSTRPYRSALSPEEAYKQIIEGSGTQFETKLVEVFKVIYPLWVELLEDFSALEVELKNNK
ncbi:HD-GYP domain-containing protein [Bacillus wiedmannii]|uniref:HD-GYP domain-containing protein n=1 Tax=Bacillus wiedmannii TaxID=1890302 RepID=UPI00352A7B99